MGPITLHSSMEHLVQYTRQGLLWIRQRSHHVLQQLLFTGFYFHWTARTPSTEHCSITGSTCLNICFSSIGQIHELLVIIMQVIIYIKSMQIGKPLDIENALHNLFYAPQMVYFSMVCWKFRTIIMYQTFSFHLQVSLSYLQNIVRIGH